MPVDSRIRDIVEETPLVDTHEHLIEESQRLKGAGDGSDGLFPCDDWAYLFMHYLRDDLTTAGMPVGDSERFLAPNTPTDIKYRLVAPWWDRVKHTGYGQAVRYTLRGLYGEDDLTEQSVFRLAEKYQELVQPGFYRTILRDKCNIEVCHVNSLQRIFCRTEHPDLLLQDIGFPPLSTDLETERVEREYGKTADTLDGWLEIVDHIFATHGPHAVAVKNQSAYGRRLNYADVTKERAEPLFSRRSRGDKLDADDRKALGDFLFCYCVRKATEYGLPVKLHTGYYAGHNYMALDRVRQNAADLCGVLHNFPDTKFVLMHMGYPYQDEFIALAKHYRNVYIDMCWAWIINPVAGVRFLKEYLMAAPANKLFPFGGDYITVETVYGHSRIARMGIAQAITELIADGWLAREEAPALIARLMHGNAHEVFPLPRR